jgi:hypothetical protein
MDSEHRRQLEMRRAELQADIERRKRLAAIRWETGLLESHGIAYEIVYGSDACARWITERFPFVPYESYIDWNLVPDHTTPGDPQEREPRAWLREVARATGGEAAPVIVVWSNGYCPAVRLALGDLIAQPGLVSGGGEAWAFREDGDWVLECTSWEGWHWGRAPAR